MAEVTRRTLAREFDLGITFEENGAASAFLRTVAGKGKTQEQHGTSGVDVNRAAVRQAVVVCEHRSYNLC